MTLQAIRPEEFPWFPYDGFTFCLGLSEGDAAWTSGQVDVSALEKLLGGMLALQLLSAAKEAAGENAGSAATPILH